MAQPLRKTEDSGDLEVRLYFRTADTRSSDEVSAGRKWKPEPSTSPSGKRCRW